MANEATVCRCRPEINEEKSIFFQTIEDHYLLFLGCTIRINEKHQLLLVLSEYVDKRSLEKRDHTQSFLLLDTKFYPVCPNYCVIINYQNQITRRSIIPRIYRPFQPLVCKLQLDGHSPKITFLKEPSLISRWLGCSCYPIFSCRTIRNCIQSAQKPTSQESDSILRSLFLSMSEPLIITL